MTAPCPTPHKRRYATDTGAAAAAKNALIPVGHHLHPYECSCGWWHLTKKSPQRNHAVDHCDLTPAERDGDLLKDASASDFAAIVQRDIKAESTLAEALALRHADNLTRWTAALKDAWLDIEAQFAAAAGDRTTQTREWRARAQTYRQALATRRREARRRSHQAATQMGNRVRQMRLHAAAEPMNIQQLRQAAGDIAIRRLIEAHHGQFETFLTEELQRLGPAPQLPVNDLGVASALRRAA
jgi:hypothetical protein